MPLFLFLFYQLTLKTGFQDFGNLKIFRFQGDWDRLRAKMCLYRQFRRRYFAKSKKIKQTWVDQKMLTSDFV